MLARNKARCAWLRVAPLLPSSALRAAAWALPGEGGKAGSPIEPESWICRGSSPAAGPGRRAPPPASGSASAGHAGRAPSGGPAAKRPRRPRAATHHRVERRHGERRRPEERRSQERSARGLPLAGLLELLDLADDHLALDAAQAIDEDRCRRGDPFRAERRVPADPVPSTVCSLPSRSKPLDDRALADGRPWR